MAGWMALRTCLACWRHECWAGCLAEAMVHLTNLAHQMAERKAYLILTDAPRVARLAWQTMRVLSTAGYLAGRMDVKKDALMYLDLHLAVM